MGAGLIFRRLIAFPESRRILRIHLLATPFLSVQWAVVPMIPFLLREYFQAEEWHVTVSTSAIPVMLFLSILWNELYRRMSAGAYLWMLWVIAIAPLAGVALCHQPLTVLVFVVISALGFGAMTPLTGDILRNCYPPAVRGRVFSLLQVLSRLVIMVLAYLIGVWLEFDEQAFRAYLPMSVLLVGLGMLLLHRIARERLFDERNRAHITQPLRASLSRAYHNMVAVFKADRDFRRYELAFFIYGTGWMICHALVPFLARDELGLNYEEFARSTTLVFELTLLVMILPAGQLMDRLGPIRTPGMAFGLLALYPLGLIAAGGIGGLAAATVVFAMGISCVHLAWTVGPVTLARNADQAPYYLAIHATMVGVRAIIGQGPAVALYNYTGRIWIPFAIASILFAIGSVLMLRLARDFRAARAPKPDVVPLPPTHARTP